MPEEPQQQMSEEQVKELQEKIKNMSPEELKEFQKKQCIFCHIVSGKVQGKRIFEDDKTLAILDINPANPGHILVLPKEHYSIMPQIPEDELQHFFMVVKSLSNACLKALDVRGANIVVANGVAAGQKANHFMAHIIPRKEGDGINFSLPQNEIPEDQLNDIAAKLGKRVSEALGKNFEDLVKEKQTNAPQKIVEAKFKEEPKKVVEAKPEEEPKLAPKEEEPKPEKAPEKKQEPKDDVDLDDIAGLLGGK